MFLGLLLCVLVSGIYGAEDTVTLVCHAEKFEYYDPLSPTKCLSCDNCIEGKGRPLDPPSKQVENTRNGATKCALCKECDEGTFNDKQALQCQSCSKCDDGYYAEENCTPKSNTKCRLCSKCGPEYDVVKKCSRTSDTECSKRKNDTTSSTPTGRASLLDTPEGKPVALEEDFPNQGDNLNRISPTRVVLIAVCSVVVMILIAFIAWQVKSRKRFPKENRTSTDIMERGQSQDDTRETVTAPMLPETMPSPNDGPPDNNTNEKTPFTAPYPIPSETEVQLPAYEKPIKAEPRIPEKKRQNQKLDSRMQEKNSATAEEKEQFWYCYEKEVDTDASSGENETTDLEIDAVMLLPGSPRRRSLKRHNSDITEGRRRQVHSVLPSQLSTPNKGFGSGEGNDDYQTEFQKDSKKRKPYGAELDFLSKRLLYGCVGIARQEGIPEHEIEAIKLDYRNAQECGFQILKKWTEVKGDKGTIEKLIEAIRSQRRDVINEFLKREFKPDEGT